MSLAGNFPKSVRDQLISASENDPTKGYAPVDVGEAPSGYGDQYDQLFANNPYRNLNYNQTGWQRFLSTLGFRTRYDDFREQAEINAQEYDAGIFSMIQQNEFNDPSAQAQRMRNAGMNPDLLGTGDVASGASPADDPNGMPAQDSGDMFGNAISAITTFAGGFSEIIAGAMSMYKNFQDINTTRLENDSLVAGIAEDDVFKAIPAIGFSSDEEFANWQNQESARVSSPDFFKLRNIPKQLQSRYRAVYSRALKDLPTDIARYKSNVERAKLRKEYSMIKGSEWYDTESDDALGAILEPLIGLSDRVTELEAKLAEKVAQNKNIEQNVVEGELENRGIEADIRGSELDFLQFMDYGTLSASSKYTEMIVGKLIAETQNEIISNLRTLSAEGSRLARCLEYQMVLSKFYNWNPYEAIKSGAEDLGKVFGQIGSWFIPSKKISTIIKK